LTNVNSVNNIGIEKRHKNLLITKSISIKINQVLVYLNQTIYWNKKA